MTSTLFIDLVSLMDSGMGCVSRIPRQLSVVVGSGSVNGDDRSDRSAAPSPYSSAMAARITETEFLKRAEQRFGSDPFPGSYALPALLEDGGHCQDSS